MVGVAVNVTLVPEQILFADAATATDAVTGALTVIVMGVDVAVEGVAQVAVEVITQVMTSPLAKAALVKMLPVPTLVPLRFH